VAVSAVLEVILICPVMPILIAAAEIVRVIGLPIVSVPIGYFQACVSVFVWSDVDLLIAGESATRSLQRTARDGQK
jgi:hypothetical protein